MGIHKSNLNNSTIDKQRQQIIAVEDQISLAKSHNPPMETELLEAHLEMLKETYNKEDSSTSSS